MIWNTVAETMPRDQLRALQLRRLRWTVARQLERVPVMRQRLLASGITDARDIASLEDLARLPFSTKADLREHYPYGLFAVPRQQLIRLHASSGTRGKPTLVGYTRHDLDVWTEVVTRTLVLGGVRPGMVLHNATGYGLFTGGLGFHMGAERLGCTVLPIGGGFSQRQVMLLQDLGGQVLKSTPSYALNIAATIEDMGVDPASLSLEIGLFGAEPWTAEMRPQLERRLGLHAVNDYGLSEIVGPGVSAECIERRDGLHIQEDHFLAEVINPESGQPVPAGVEGELVLTTLTKEALPLVRYRTGDLSWLMDGPCVCGRTFVRMGPVRGRLDDMLIVRGVNLYPSEIERVLLGLPDVGPNYQILVERPAALDELTVTCESASATSDREALARTAAQALLEATGLHMRVTVLPPGAVPRSEGKAVRVLDRRAQ